MTAQAKRVRTKFLGGAVNGKELMSTTVILGPGLQHEWVVQDNITIIGAEIITEIDVTDSHSNADFMCQLIGELSRAATIERDSAILSCQQEMIWNALISMGGDCRRMAYVMFPAGYGIDVDEGEHVNLLSYCSYIGAGGDLWVFFSAIVYYVER